MTKRISLTTQYYQENTGTPYGVSVGEIVDFLFETNVIPPFE
jgi:hypothetical protein